MLVTHFFNPVRVMRLLEIVTGPDISSAEEAKRFLQVLRQTIVELGISDAMNALALAEHEHHEEAHAAEHH